MARRRNRGRPVNGIFLLNKPKGLTSNQALQRVKNLFDANKAGHTGSLDPLATGVLPICLGEATKFSQFLLDSDKHYRSTFTLGVTTDTGDCDGDVREKKDASAITERQVLSAIEQAEIAKIQIEQTKQQLAATKKRVEVGLLPELNLLELETQLANDSSTFITASANIDQSKMLLKALLNLDASKPFDIQAQSVDQIKLQSFADLQPDYVFGIASQNLPGVRAAALRVKAASKNQLVAKSSFYPSVSFGYNLSSNFSNVFNYVSGFNFSGYSTPTVASPFVTVNSTKYFIQSPVYTAVTSQRNWGNIWNGWGNQVNNNFGQSFGFQMNIPIFNANQSKISYAQAKLNYRSASLQEENTNLKLKQDIYTAYTNAVVAFNKLAATQKAVTSAEKTYQFATKRYDLGLLGTIELLNNQNNFLKAKVNFKSAQYEYVFRIKLLEFYKGEALSL